MEEDTAGTVRESQTSAGTVQIVWELPGFTRIRTRPGGYLLSKDFVAHGHPWQMKLFPNGTDREWKGWLEVELCFKGTQEIQCAAQVFTASPDAQTIREGAGWLDYLPMRPNQKEALGVQVWKDAIADAADQDNLLVVVCNISKRLEISSTPSALSVDFKTLMTRADFSDVTIEVQGTRLPAHRAILAARSPFFKAMFSHPMVEKENRIVHLDDMDLAVFRAILSFMYTGERPWAATALAMDTHDTDVEESKDSQDSKGLKDSKDTEDNEKPVVVDVPFVAQILEAADRFQLPELVAASASWLCEHLTVQNAADLLVVADAHSCWPMKQCVLRFMCHPMQRRQEIMDTPGYQKLSRLLLNDMMTTLTPESDKKRKLAQEKDEHDRDADVPLKKAKWI